MKSYKYIFLLTCILLLASCSSAEISEEHLKFLNDNGWTVNRVMEKELFSLPDNEEMLNQLGELGLNPEELVKHETLYMQVVLLKERCQGKLRGVIFSNQDDEVVGAQIVKEDGNPGASKLVGSSTYLDECNK